MSDTMQCFKTSLGREIFFSFKPGKGAALVFLNGLDDSLEVWKNIVSEIKTSQPCLFVDLLGQGESLKSEMQSQKAYDYDLTVTEQGSVLGELLESLSIQSVDLVGNSYGAGVALWFASQSLPQKLVEVKKLILLNPFILRLDLAFPMARFYVAQYEWLQALTPQVLRSPFRILENSYGRFIENYMDHRFRNRIPDPDLRKVKVELSKGMMGFNSFEVLKQLPDKTVYLLFSELDTLVPKSLYLEFWMRLAPEKKRNCFQLLGGDHLLLETGAPFVKRQLQSIFSGSLEPSSKVVSCQNITHEPAPGARQFGL